MALHKYKKNQQQNNLDSSIPVQELTSDDIQQSQEKNKSTNTPSKDTKAPKNKESEVIQNPDPEPEISKQDLIKYISKKHSPDSSDKMHHHVKSPGRRDRQQNPPCPVLASGLQADCRYLRHQQ